jgi:ATP-binding cassette, subfamily B, multidrug efflux pump
MGALNPCMARPAGTLEGFVIDDLRARLFPYLARYRRGLAWGILCVVLTDLVALTQPQVLRLAVDDLYRGVTSQKLFIYALILLAIALVAGFFRYWMRQAVIGISRHIEYDLRNDVFEHLQRLPLQYFQHTRTGEIMSRATNDLSAVRMMLGPGVMYMVNTTVVAVVSVGFMIAISPRLTFYSLLPLPLVSFIVWYFGDRIHRRFEEIQAQFATISAKVQENLAGVRVVRAFAREARELDDFRELNREHLRRNTRLIQTSGVFHPALGFLSGLAALLGLYLGGREVIAGHITLGEFVAFTVYLAMLNWPMVALGWVISLFQRGTASLGRLGEIIDTVPEIRDAPDARVLTRCRGELEIRDLTFAYPGAADPALVDVSLVIPAGDTVALVGRTGSGKSTLLALLARVFDPPPGTVFVDGIDVREISLASLRAQIAAVPQDTFLFTATVHENVAYGVDVATREEVEAVTRIAGLDADIRDFPAGYETLVGERGITLSGGQRQRATIARALLRGAPILMLDDCLSSVDTHTEDAILHGLRREMKGRTTLIVSHRVSTVRDADRIVVLDHGRIVESGIHDELIALDGEYAALYRRQQLEEELEAS